MLGNPSHWVNVCIQNVVVVLNRSSRHFKSDMQTYCQHCLLHKSDMQTYCQHCLLHKSDMQTYCQHCLLHKSDMQTYCQHCLLHKSDMQTYCQHCLLHKSDMQTYCQHCLLHKPLVYFYLVSPHTNSNTANHTACCAWTPGGHSFDIQQVKKGEVLPRFA